MKGKDVAITIRLAVRDWDYLTPLLLGDIKPSGFELQVVRVNTLSDDISSDPNFEGGEISFSRYTQDVARGSNKLVGIPHFLMRGFRQRCIITREDSPLTTLGQLKGKRIGLTGWQDSGNTWTRTLLRREGVEIDDAFWFVGRLTQEHPIVDRLAGFGRPGRIETARDELPLLELLERGELDAIFTPFMPEGFFAPDSGLRQLQPDFRQAEADYFKQDGYVPGIHVLGLKPEVVAAHPWLPQALSDVLDQSYQLWMAKRAKYADTTPWLLDDLRRTQRDLSAGWNDNGYQANYKMIADFANEMYVQQLIAEPLTPAALFPFSASAAQS